MTSERGEHKHASGLARTREKILLEQNSDKKKRERLEENWTVRDQRFRNEDPD